MDTLTETSPNFPIPGSTITVPVSEFSALPITRASIEVARRHRRWPRATRKFNRIFYRALEEFGHNEKKVHEDLSRLLDFREDLGLTPRQVRGAYGYERGVMNADGTFRKSELSGTDWQAMLMQGGQDLTAEKRRGPFTLEQWPTIEAEALAMCSGKKEQADVAEEYRWIRANLYEWPEFYKAPSRGAIKEWLAISRPGNEQWMRDFLDTQRTKRLSPGDSASKKAKAKTAFVEDSAESSASGEEEYLKELKERT